MSASTIVTSLIDIVSKNGNLLLDIGPKADGSIAEIEQQNLRVAGTWIKDHGEAIYGTQYWAVTAQEGPQIRFTRTDSAFYILVNQRPPERLIITSPIPWIEGDAVTVVGGKACDTVVPSHRLANGSVALHLSQSIIEADRFAWVFKITY
jgi:alpha-L-fucosidase